MWYSKPDQFRAKILNYYKLPRLLATYYDTKKFVYDMDSTAMPSEQMQQVRNSGFKACLRRVQLMDERARHPLPQNGRNSR